MLAVLPSYDQLAVLPQQPVFEAYISEQLDLKTPEDGGSIIFFGESSVSFGSVVF